MAKKKQTTKVVEQERDSVYFLKLVLYIVIGSAWIKFQDPISFGALQFYGFPFGLIVGLLFASHDHFQIDRKVEYALLLIVTIAAFFLPIGIFI